MSEAPSFPLGAFVGRKLELVETIATHREGGPAWMFSEIEKIWSRWTSLGFSADRCGVGFGGPVDFPSQTVTLSTHVAGWAQYPLLDNLRHSHWSSWSNR